MNEKEAANYATGHYDNIFIHRLSPSFPRVDSEDNPSPSVELPPRKEGCLVFPEITVSPKEPIVGTEQAFSFSFWPEKWRIDVVRGSSNDLYLRQVFVGVERVYPRAYLQEPRAWGFISRPKSAEIAALHQKHQDEGCRVEEATKYKFPDLYLLPYQRVSWQFTQRGADPVTFRVVVEGLEVA